MFIHMWCIPLALALIGFGGYEIATHCGKWFEKKPQEGGGTASQKDRSDKASECRAKEGHDFYYNWGEKSCNKCPKVDHEYMTFWYSGQDGCLDFVDSAAADHVTSMVWGYAYVEGTGKVRQSMQGSDETMNLCMDYARAKCIKQYVAVGGVGSMDSLQSMIKERNQKLLASDLTRLVEKYNFDGVEIVDLNNNGNSGGNWANSSDYAVDYVKSIRTALDDKFKDGDRKKIFWDEFAVAADSKACNKGNDTLDVRCLNTKITDMVDGVVVRNYDGLNNKDYDKFLDNIPNTWAKTIKSEKLIIAGCAGEQEDDNPVACELTAPSLGQLQNDAKTGLKYGGFQLFASKSALKEDNIKDIAGSEYGSNVAKDW